MDDGGSEVVAFFLTLVAGLATCVGAVFPFFVKTTNTTLLAGALGFSAGVMSFVSFIEIFMKSRSAFQEIVGEQHELLATMGCFFGGIMLAAFLDFLVHLLGHDLPHDHHHGHDHQPQKLLQEDAGCGLHLNGEHTDDCKKNARNGSATSEDALLDPAEGDSLLPPARRLSAVTTVKFTQNPIQWIREDWRGFEDVSEEGKRLKSMGLVTALAIAIHNFPEGLATFVATLADPGAGVSLAFAIAVHNIPEGISVAMPIYFATGSRLRAFVWAAVSGLSEPLGAAIGWGIISLADNDVMFGVMFGLVAGMMVFISFKELLPTAHSYDPRDRVTSWSLFGGMMLMAASLLLFQYV